jgi:CheY-like chemotaxis protein
LGCPRSQRAAVKEPAPAVANDRPPLSGLSILLAEDNLVNQRLAVLLLKKLHHEVTVVDDGRKAVEATEQRQFDLVLMDVQMPVLDGFAAVAEIRERESRLGRHTSIVAMTAHALKGDRERCLAAGMDGYVSKPIHPQELYAVIEAVLRNKGDVVSSTHEPAEELAEPAVTIDWALALEHAGGDKALLREVVEVFLMESPKMLDEARAALAAEDFSRLRRAGHSLKGACGAL